MSESNLTVKSFKSLKENKDLRDQAMAMYMHDDFYPTEICDKLHIDIEELGLYVFGENRKGDSKTCWRYLKDTGQMPKFISVYEKIKPMYIKKTEKKILDIANKLLDKTLESEDKIQDMDTKDLNNLVSAMEKIDKIGRLEEGKATAHTVTERKSFSLREIIANKKEEDEKIVDAEFKNLPTSRGSDEC